MYATKKRYKLGRWNFSENANKWVFIEQKNGKRRYIYQVKPPKEFAELIEMLKSINEQIQHCKTADENNILFEKLVSISKQMQKMRRGE